MATTTKSIYLYKENPNGTNEKCNDLTQYTIYYNERGHYYYLSLTPCTRSTLGISFVFDFVNRNVTLAKVNRRSAKAQKACETFLTNNIDALNTAYLCNGMAGVNEVVRDLWNLTT